jgi:DNA-binding SARP family transcriptional activator
MNAEVEFCLLGPLVVRRNSMVVSVPQGKQRTVLAALLMNAGRAVSIDDLTETLWAGAPPPSAKVTTQNYVMRLRRALGTAGSLISTQPHGYLIRVDTSELDLQQFEAHLATAHEAARDSSWQAVAAEARAALALWRGEPLADIDSELLRTREAPRLAEMRLQALETCIDADLHLGRHAEVITELQRLTADHPLREQLHGLLMLALYKENRQAEALAAYRQARQVLVEELGTEPGAALQKLHQQILSADPALADPGPAPPARPTASPAIPRQLPPGVGHFTGRTRELATLTELLDTSEKKETPGMVVISAIGGTAGVGKTALALHWAHRVAHRFPDGHLYINLRGFDPSGNPTTPAEVIRGFLDSLGVAPERIPAIPDALAGMYRSLVADKRMLIMLDNARDERQVRPLLPASPHSLVVVTSRSQLAGLAATDGARLLSLNVLTHGEAVELLTARIGPSAAAEPEAIAEIATRCAGLPLALAVAAARAAEQPGFAIATLAAELGDAVRRLDALDTGDAPASVRAVFSWSYRQLGTEAARMNRLLGLHPGPDIEPYAAAALTGAQLQQARRVLDVLARANLIQPAAPGRYGMHDLLQAYARELSANLDSQEDQHAALTRLFDHYLYTAATAMDTLFPAGRHIRPRIPRPDTPVPPLPDPAAARQWVDGERAALVAAAAHTAAHGWPGHATRLAATLASYLLRGGHFPEAVTVFGHALSAARRTADRAAEATALNLIGNVGLEQGRFQEASDHYRQSLALCRAAGDRAGEARVLGNMGIAEMNWAAASKPPAISRKLSPSTAR